jgi:hypothetical protein
MLTNQELMTARDNLRAANVLIDVVRGLYLGGGLTQGALLLNDVAGVIGGELETLAKKMDGVQVAPALEQR